MEYNEFADHWVMTMEGYKIDICFSVCFFKILFPTMYMTCYCICVLLVPLEWCHTLHFFLSCFPYNNMRNSIYLQFKTFYHKNYDFVPTKITTFLLIYYNHLFLPLVNLELLHTSSGCVAHEFRICSTRVHKLVLLNRSILWTILCVCPFSFGRPIYGYSWLSLLVSNMSCIIHGFFSVNQKYCMCQCHSSWIFDYIVSK
jgi:hypothetical protein